MDFGALFTIYDERKKNVTEAMEKEANCASLPPCGYGHVKRVK